jgi:hypothetical protein
MRKVNNESQEDSVKYVLVDRYNDTTSEFNSLEEAKEDIQENIEPDNTDFSIYKVEREMKITVGVDIE